MILPASSSLALARSLARVLPSFPCLFLANFVFGARERAGEGGEICPERNIMITPRVRRAQEGEGGGGKSGFASEKAPPRRRFGSDGSFPL